jgi:hypothetical protein
VGYVVCGELKLAPTSTRSKTGGGSEASAPSSLPAPIQSSPAHLVASQRALTNADILDLSKAGISPDILVAKIKSSACNFDTSPAALQSLKTANLGDDVVLAMIEAPIGQTEATPPPSASPLRAASAAVSNSSVATPSGTEDDSIAGSPCVILKRMGPADQITSHLYAFGLRGKQFQFVEGQLPKGATFHGRLTDHDIRIIRDKGGRLFILEPKYSVSDLEEARKGCQKPD